MLTYIDAGGGAPVVLLHGNPDCKEGWEPVIELLRSEHRCIAPDLPGFGVEARVPSWRSLFPDAQARALAELLDSLGIAQPVLLVVHDLGALMGACFAMQFPERVRGILSINTTFSAGYPGHLWGYLWALPLLGPAFASLMRVGLKDALSKASPLVPARDFERMAQNLDFTTCRAISRYYAFMYNPLVKIFQRFGGTPQDKGVPVRVLWGAEDRYIPLKYAREGDEPLRLVEGCTHWLPLERPDLVAEEVRAWDGP